MIPMTKKRRRFSPEFKFRVALEAAKGQRTISELSSEYGVHPNQVSQWKRQLLESGAEVFNQNGSKAQRDQQAVQTELYEQIGRLKMELEWVKKKSAQFS
jgi:putative transposase